MRTIRVDTRAEQGVFEGWGTSLAWWADAVGRLPQGERERAVRRIFGFADGGLGMSIARFNAGGGENPGIESTLEPRAAMEGYRPAPDVDLDPNADPGQRAVLRDAARILAEEGCELTVEVFGNSPPWWATVSGSVTGACGPGQGGSGKRPAPNLAPDRARDYLRYLADVADFIERDADGRVASLSPFNEPTSRWWVLGGRQEGCHFTPEGVDALLAELAEMPEVTRGRVVAASEEWSLEQTLATWDALSATARRITGRLNVHTYDGESRAAVRARAAQAGVGLWVSEFGEGGAAGYELALGIVRDLRELAPSAWVLWQAVSPDAWGPLRIALDGAVTPSPKLDVLARFTRSIRPGMRLVGSDDALSVAAVGDGRLAAVIVAEQSADATTPAEQAVRLELPPGSVMGTAEVTIASAVPNAGPPRAQRVESDGTAIEFALPAGAVASVTAEFTPPRASDAVRFGGSGTWWLEHESGSRLGLSAAGAEELCAGLGAAGVSADDDALAQRWRMEACGDGSARWVCDASGLQLDVRHGSRRTGARVIQWRAGLAEHTPANSRFHIAEMGGGFVQLIVHHSGCALALDERGRAVQRRMGSAGTRWRLVRAGGARG